MDYTVIFVGGVYHRKMKVLDHPPPPHMAVPIMPPTPALYSDSATLHSLDPLPLESHEYRVETLHVPGKTWYLMVLESFTLEYAFEVLFQGFCKE